MLSYFQAVVIGLLQGVTELFPISSLGHSVLLPGWLGWDALVKAQSSPESFYLAFVVALHVGTALALLVFFRDEWIRIIKGFFTMVRNRRVETPDERMALLLIVGTIPVGVVGLIFEHSLRTLFAKPVAAAVFLCINAVVLFAGEQYRRRVERETATHGRPLRHRDLDTLAYGEAAVIGSGQIAALFAGISRSGVTMVSGLARGLDHEDAARFSFLLATPVILAAGLVKIPDLTGPLGSGIRGQAVVGALCAGAAAYVSVKFLVRFFQTRTLYPFAIYCLVAGVASVIRFA